MKTKTNFLAAGIVLAAFVNVLSQPANKASYSGDGLWQAVEQLPAEKVRPQRSLLPSKFRAFALNHAALQTILNQAPREFTEEGRRNPTELTLPMPDGTFARFRIVESPIMEPELAAKFPEIKTYCGQGIDDPAATVRCGITPRGFHAQVLSPNGAVQIEPVDDASQTHLSFFQRDMAASVGRWACSTSEAEGVAAPPTEPSPPAAAKGDNSPPGAAPPTVMLRIYRLAIAADGEYTTINGGPAGAMAEIVSTINRANGVFEPELAIRLVLVANNDLIIYTDPVSDPYPPLDPCPLATHNQVVLDSVIGAANYDIGHVLSGRTGSGCVDSSGGVVCQNGQKAKGSSAWPFPPGFGMNYLNHELGHQLGANHSWNGTGGGCVSSQYSAVSAYEPGSGSTIMSYVGGCAGDNLQPVSDMYYHSGSLDQINNYVNGGGAVCRVLQPTSDLPPAVSAGLNYSIPARTPFVLTATGSDPDGDTVTYCWEQRDLGPAQPLTGPGSTDNGSSPLFRSFLPTTNASRTFPRLTDILNNRPPIGEQLPSRNRTLHFRVTARDHRFGVSAANMQVTVVSNASPFRVVAPNSGLVWSGQQTVLWDVAGTTNAPISTTNVNILLSTNGGDDFPITLASNTQNDGSEVITLPDLYAPQARIKVAAVGNIFFDISRTNFTIVPAAPVLVAVGAALVTEGCQPTNGVIDPGETVTLETVFRNVGAADATELVVTLLAGGGVQSPNPSHTNATVPAGGGLVTNAFAFTASLDRPCGGAITPTFQLRDGPGTTNTAVFSFRLGKTELVTTSVANTNVIRITSGLPGSVYPSPIEVAEVPSAVDKITATLSNLTHPFPFDLDVLLVGPGGQKVLLMSQTAAGSANNATLTFDDGAPFSLDEVPQAVSGVYKLTLTDQEWTADVFPLPAPAGPYSRRLSGFNGTNPNGTWRLYVNDTYQGSDGITGGIAGGWSLNITTSNTVCCNPLGLALNMADSPDPVTVGSNLTYAITVSNVSPAEATGVIVSNLLPPSVSFVSASSSQGSCANSSGLVTCNLGTLAVGASATVNLVVTPSVVGTITNTAGVTRNGAGPHPTGNTPTSLTTVEPFPSLFIADAALTEGNAGTLNLVFPVSLSVGSPQLVTVNYTTSDGSALAGSDYVATNGTLTFNPGGTFQTLRVAIPGDTLRESNKTFAVILSAPTNAIIERGAAVGTILDNDFVSLSIVNAAVTEGNAGTTNANFVVRLSAMSGATVTAGYFTFNNTATAGSDFVLSSGTVSFPPGTTNQTVSVPVIGDLLNEFNETFQLQIVSATYAALPAAAATGTIINDDALPALAINDVAVVEGNSGTNLAVFTVSLSPASGRIVTVTYATSNDTATAGVDYVAKSGSLTFPSGTTNLSLAITINGDQLAEFDEAFFVNLTGSANSTIADAQAVGTILNDELWLTALVLAGGDVRLNFFTESNQTYRVERAASLVAPIIWFPVPGATTVAGTGSTVEVTDTGAANQPQQFYRVKLLP